MLGDPRAGPERVDQGLVETAPGTVPVEIFEGRLAAQVGGLEAPLQLALLAMRPLGVDEEA